MKLWNDFLGSLNSDGGHILLLLVLTSILTMMGGQSIEKFQGECIGALLMACRGQGNRPQSGV